jgi:hypothetical protein
MYSELADWWPLLSAPGDYLEEATVFRRTLVDSGVRPLRTLLELGSGGGNNASHLKAHFAMTLVDLAPGMLDVSRRLNPECIHVQGDMRSVRLGRLFDAVFVHDAVCYMTSEAELREAMATAFVHCRPEGVALFAPDHVKETFVAGTDHGGHDGEDRGLRFLEWSWDPDPEDTTCLADYVYAFREGVGPLRVETERHVEGLFPRATWLQLLTDVGFLPEVITWEHSELSDPLELFLARRP